MESGKKALGRIQEVPVSTWAGKGGWETGMGQHWPSGIASLLLSRPDAPPQAAFRK